MPETPDDRAEAAFRDAFTRYADDLEPRPLTTPTRRRRWPAVVAAAAVAAVAGLSFALTTDATDGTDDRSEPSGTTPTESAPTTQPDPSVRWVSYRDVEVAVPASWGDEYPRSAFPECLVDRDPAPAGPYVEKHGSGQVIPTIGCAPSSGVRPGFPAYDRELWVSNLILADAGGSSSRVPDGTVEHAGWSLTTRTVGDVRLELLADAATSPSVESILASAREVDRDTAGCDASSPIQSPGFTSPPAHDLAADGVDTSSGAAVCEYEVGSKRGAPGLLGSRRLSPEQAADVRAAILEGAEGGGPRSAGCGSRDSFNVGTAVVLRFGAAGSADPVDVYTYYESCTNRGFDDGTTLRALSVEACSPLFGGRVDYYSASAGSFELCRADR